MKITHAVRSVACALVAFALAVTLLMTPHGAGAQDEPVATDPLEVAPVFELEDGTYTIEVTLTGGSGRAYVVSPAKMTVVDGAATAHVEWSSPYYDYLIVAGERYLPVNQEGNSAFDIPVLALDEPFALVGDTTAMSEPHEIDYELVFDTSTMQVIAQESDAQQLDLTVPGVLGVVVIAGCVLFMVTRGSEAMPED